MDISRNTFSSIGLGRFRRIRKKLDSNTKNSDNGRRADRNYNQ